MGYFSEDTRYELIDIETKDYRLFSSDMNGLSLGLGLWVKVPNVFLIYGEFHIGKALMKFREDGDSDIKVKNINFYEIEVNALKDIYQWKDYGIFGVNLGMNLTSYDVDSFSYNGRDFGSNDFQGDVNFKIGFTFSF